MFFVVPTLRFSLFTRIVVLACLLTSNMDAIPQLEKVTSREIPLLHNEQSIDDCLVHVHDKVILR